MLSFTFLLVVPFAFRQIRVHDGIVKESLLFSNFAPFEQHETIAMQGIPRNQFSRRKVIEAERRNADGSFNGFPIYFNNGSKPYHSTVHCVGDNHLKSAWMYRSCEFRHLCFDTEAKQYVIYRSALEKALSQAIDDRNDSLVSVSTLTNVSVSVGGINPRWNEDRNRLKWFPKIEEEPLTQGFYELPSDVVVVPFHSLAGFNAGHLYVSRNCSNCHGIFLS